MDEDEIDLGDLDKEFNDDLDMDAVSEPKLPKRGVADTAKVYASGAAYGALESIRPTLENEIDNAMPDTKSIFDAGIDTIDKLTTVKDQFTDEMRPIIRDLKKGANKILPGVRAMLPKGIYSKLEALTASEEDEAPKKSAARQKAESENALIQQGMDSIFKTQKEGVNAQMQQANALQEENRLADVQNKVMQTAQHKQTLGIMDHIRSGMRDLVDFHLHTYTAFLKKDLELKYRQGFILKDLLQSSMTTQKLLDSKLEVIVNNTAMPDKLKVTAKDALNTKDLFNKTVGNYIGTFGDMVIKNTAVAAKDKILSTAKTAQGLVGTLGQTIAGAKEAEMSDDQLADLIREQLGSVGGDFVANMALSSAVRPVLDKLPHWTEKAEELSKNWKAKGINSIQKFKNKHSTGIMGKLLQLAIPNFNPNVSTPVVKSGRPTEIANFDNAVHSSIVEIIPGYLARILAQTESVRNTIAPSDGKDDLLKFDHQTGMFSRSSKITAKLEQQILGNKGRSAEVAVGNIEHGFKEKTGLDVDAMKEYRPYIKQMFMNLSFYALDLDPVEIFKYVQQAMATPGIIPGGSSYITKMVKDIPRHYVVPTLKNIILSITDDGKVDGDLVRMINNSILAEAQDDSYRTALPRILKDFNYKEELSDYLDENGKIKADKIISKKSIYTDESAANIDSAASSTESALTTSRENTAKISADIGKVTERFEGLTEQAKTWWEEHKPDEWTVKGVIAKLGIDRELLKKYGIDVDAIEARAAAFAEKHKKEIDNLNDYKNIVQKEYLKAVGQAKEFKNKIKVKATELKNTALQNMPKDVLVAMIREAPSGNSLKERFEFVSNTLGITPLELGKLIDGHTIKDPITKQSIKLKASETTIKLMMKGKNTDAVIALAKAIFANIAKYNVDINTVKGAEEGFRGTVGDYKAKTSRKFDMLKNKAMESYHDSSIAQGLVAEAAKHVPVAKVREFKEEFDKKLQQVRDLTPEDITKLSKDLVDRFTAPTDLDRDMIKTLNVQSLDELDRIEREANKVDTHRLTDVDKGFIEKEETPSFLDQLFKRLEPYWQQQTNQIIAAVNGTMSEAEGRGDGEEHLEADTPVVEKDNPIKLTLTGLMGDIKAGKNPVIPQELVKYVQDYMEKEGFKTVKSTRLKKVSVKQGGWPDANTLGKSWIPTKKGKVKYDKDRLIEINKNQLDDVTKFTPTLLHELAHQLDGSRVRKVTREERARKVIDGMNEKVIPEMLGTYKSGIVDSTMESIKTKASDVKEAVAEKASEIGKRIKAEAEGIWSSRDKELFKQMRTKMDKSVFEKTEDTSDKTGIDRLIELAEGYRDYRKIVDAGLISAIEDIKMFLPRTVKKTLMQKAIGAAMKATGIGANVYKEAIKGAYIGAGHLAGGLASGAGSLIGGVSKGVGGIASSIGNIFTAGITIGRKPKYVDVYLKDQVNPKGLLLSAKDQKAGKACFANGDKIEKSSDIVKTVYKVTTSGKRGNVIISKSDLEHGLVDSENKSIYTSGSGAKKINLADIGMGVVKAYSNIYGGALKSIGNIASSTIGIFQDKKPKYVDVYTKTENGLKLRLTAKRQVEGTCMYKNGDEIKHSSDINQPVYTRTKKPRILISQEDIDNGLVDVEGKKITKGGLGLAGMVTKGISGAGSILKSVFTNGTDLYADLLKKGADLAHKGVTGVMNRLFGTKVDIKPILEKMATMIQSLEEIHGTIVEIRDGGIIATGKKKVSGDTDGDGDRDGSWQDQLANQHGTRNSKGQLLLGPGVSDGSGGPGGGGPGDDGTFSEEGGNSIIDEYKEKFQDYKDKYDDAKDGYNNLKDWNKKRKRRKEAKKRLKNRKKRQSDAARGKNRRKKSMDRKAKNYSKDRKRDRRRKVKETKSRNRKSRRDKKNRRKKGGISGLTSLLSVSTITAGLGYLGLMSPDTQDTVQNVQDNIDTVEDVKDVATDAVDATKKGAGALKKTKVGSKVTEVVSKRTPKSVKKTIDLAKSSAEKANKLSKRAKALMRLAKKSKKVKDMTKAMRALKESKAAMSVASKYTNALKLMKNPVVKAAMKTVGKILGPAMLAYEIATGIADGLTMSTQEKYDLVDKSATEKMFGAHENYFGTDDWGVDPETGETTSYIKRGFGATIGGATNAAMGAFNTVTNIARNATVAVTMGDEAKANASNLDERLLMMKKHELQKWGLSKSQLADWEALDPEAKEKQYQMIRKMHNKALKPKRDAEEKIAKKKREEDKILAEAEKIRKEESKRRVNFRETDLEFGLGDGVYDPIEKRAEELKTAAYWKHREWARKYYSKRYGKYKFLHVSAAVREEMAAWQRDVKNNTNRYGDPIDKDLDFKGKAKAEWKKEQDTLRKAYDIKAKRKIEAEKKKEEERKAAKKAKKVKQQAIKGGGSIKDAPPKTEVAKPGVDDGQWDKQELADNIEAFSKDLKEQHIDPTILKKARTRDEFKKLLSKLYVERPVWKGNQPEPTEPKGPTPEEKRTAKLEAKANDNKELRDQETLKETKETKHINIKQLSIQERIAQSNDMMVKLLSKITNTPTPQGPVVKEPAKPVVRSPLINVSKATPA